MVAPYPVYEKEFDDLAAANQYEQIIATVRVARSLLDAYGIKQEANRMTIWTLRLIHVS